MRINHGLWLGLMFLVTAGNAILTPQDLPDLIVEEIGTDSAAAKAGLKLADSILTYDGKPLPSPAALQAAAENTFGKTEVALRIRRGQETLTLILPPGRSGIHARPELLPPALTLYEEGKAAQKGKQSDEVITKWTAASKAAQEVGNKSAAAWLHGRVGEIHEEQRRWKEASASHMAAWEILKESHDAAAQTRTLSALGRCSHNLNDFLEARRRFEHALQIDTVAGHEMWVADHLSKLGIVARARSDPQAAQNYFSSALAIRERLAPDSLDLATSLDNLGNIANDRGDLNVAQDYYNRALAIRERLAPDSLDLAASLNYLGRVAHTRGDLAMAQDYASRGFAIQERLAPNSPILATSLNNLGVIARARGDLMAAQDYYSRSLAINERLAPNSLTVASSLNNLGNLASERGDLQTAQDYHARALAIRNRLVPNTSILASSLNNLALVYYLRGDLAAAQDYHGQALAINERLAANSPAVAASLNNLGAISRDRGDLAAARDYHQRALAIRERLASNSLDVATSLHNLGNIAYDRGELEAAQDYYRRALEIRERLAPNSLSVAASFNLLGSVAYNRGNLQAAQDYYGRALAIRERLAPNSLDAAGSLTNLGLVALKEHRLSEARSLLTRALDIVENHRGQVPSSEARAFLVAKYTKLYSGLLRTSLALNDLPAAFGTVERARARSLLDLLAEANIDIQQGIEPALKQREQATHTRIAWIQRELIEAHSQSPDKKKIAHLEEQLKQVEREREQVKLEIRQKHPRYAELQYPTPLGLKAIQDLLDPETALLEYALGEERSFLFVVTKTDAFVAELLPAPSLSERVKQLRETLIARPQRSTLPVYIEQARALHRLLIEPALKSVKGKRQLVIVPDGILHYLPFEVLLSSGNEQSLTAASPSRWPYLIRDYSLSYAPSATVLASLRRSRQAKPVQEKALLAYADPVYGATEPAAANPVHSALRSAFGDSTPWRLEPLPNSREEANRIAALYPQEKVRVFLQRDAREENVKTEAQLNQYRFVHFAAHGLLNEMKPQFSGLVLSLPAEENRQSSIVNRQFEDGLLQVYEIFDLKLNADLVVLSACETGLGKEVKGEGLVGLTRAFLYAGTPSVVVSLWKVSDRSTAELMVSFYQGLKGAASKAEALRQAQLKLIREGRYAHPYYWAPFILVGEAN